MKNFRFYLIFSGIGVIIILLIVFLRFSPESKVFLPVKSQEVPKLEIQNFKLIQTSGDKKQWELEANQALEYEEIAEIHIKNTKIKFFKENKPVLSLNANEGIIDLKTKNIRITGKVNAVSQDKLELKTDSLLWLSKDEKLVTDDNIVLTREGMKIKGMGLEADVALGKLQIKKFASIEIPRK